LLDIIIEKQAEVTQLKRAARPVLHTLRSIQETSETMANLLKELENKRIN
jgi:hypothetical protein